MNNVLLLLLPLCELLQLIFVSAQSPAIVFQTMAPTVPRQCFCYSGIVCPAGTTGGVDVRIVNNGTYCSTGFVYCCSSGGGGGGSNIGINAPTCGRVYIAPTPQPAGQAAFGEFPWQVALYARPNIYVGGGALITSLHVLTAFHKVTSYLNGGLVARLGEWDFTVTNERYPFRDIDVEMISNMTFTANNLQNDIAVLKLKEPAPIGPPNNPHINTVCLAFGPPVPGTRCKVAGWGKTAFNGQYPQSILKQVDLPVVSSADCQTALRKTTLGANFALHSSFMCAGGEAGKDACIGDGGSALVCPSNGFQTAVGLVSWGIKCADGGVPAAYTDVNKFDSWIKSVAVV
ncbi:phenoloxidase-activating factor 2-like [Linepithema humile]|uniref:phenoloxidase-activating factor 2-like n=1 Tax=Linepithema humile TaxID=83485 RepID=UPI0006235973|nr:PREDICTED: trypsin-3-like [Linepithema humile]